MQPQHIFLQGLTLEQFVEAMQPAIRFAVAEAAATAVAAALGQTTGADEKWTVKASAEYLNISKATIFEWLRRGILPSTKLGGRTYLLPSDVLAAGIQRQRTTKPGRAKNKPPP